MIKETKNIDFYTTGRQPSELEIRNEYSESKLEIS